MGSRLLSVRATSYGLLRGIFRDDLFPLLNVGEELEFEEHPLVLFEQRSHLVGWVGGVVGEGHVESVGLINC